MKTNVLLVGCEYTGEKIENTQIETLGLINPKIDQNRAAFALYEYDVIIINPESYSHFIFGKSTKHSSSDKELWDLKTENQKYDLDTAFDSFDRSEELTAAIDGGTRVVFLLSENKRIQFFGWRSNYIGYANPIVKKLIQTSTLYHKKSRKLSVTAEAGQFRPYFEQLQLDGWSLCISDFNDNLNGFAFSPEGYCLGGKVKVESSTAWLLTPPSSEKAMNILVKCIVGVPQNDVSISNYHGIFLSHNSSDKPFVRELKNRLHSHGVKEVWLDEAEIMVGDSLTKKIEEGLKKTKYIGVVLSPRSVASPWVGKELEIAITQEITSGEVVVLPLLYEKCDLPSFLVGKMYADFTSSIEFDEGVAKLLRRLKIQ